MCLRQSSPPVRQSCQTIRVSPLLSDSSSLLGQFPTPKFSCAKTWVLVLLVGITFNVRRGIVLLCLTDLLWFLVDLLQHLTDLLRQYQDSGVSLTDWWGNISVTMCDTYVLSQCTTSVGHPTSIYRACGDLRYSCRCLSHWCQTSQTFIISRIYWVRLLSYPVAYNLALLQIVSVTWLQSPTSLSFVHQVISAQSFVRQIKFRIYYSAHFPTLKQHLARK